MGIPVPSQNFGVPEGVAHIRSYRDITDQEITDGWTTYYTELEEQERLAAEAAAEAERQRIALELAEQQERERREEEERRNRPPLIDTVLAAFSDTLFAVRAEPVYRVVHEPSEEAIEAQEMGWEHIRNDEEAELASEHTTPTPIIIPNAQAIVNCRTNQVLSIKTDEYEIIQDADVLREYCQRFEESRIAVNPIRHHVTRSKDGVYGRTTYMEVELPEFTLESGEGVCNTRIIITNSNDGTKKNRIYKMHWVQSESGRPNQMGLMGWSQNFGLSTKHRTGANARLARSLTASMTESIERERAVITRLASLNTTQERVYNYIESNPLLSGDRNVEKLTGAWMLTGSSVNLWQVYQVFARTIIQYYGLNFGTKIQKLWQLNSEVKRNWDRVFNVQIGFAEMGIVDALDGEDN